MTQVTLDIMRPGAIVTGLHPTYTKEATITAEVLPLSPDAAARLVAPANIGDAILYTQYRILTVDAYGQPLVPCPDIRVGKSGGDLLVDTSTPNTSTGTTSTTYVVHGVNQYGDPLTGSFLDIHAQVQAQPSQTGG